MAAAGLLGQWYIEMLVKGTQPATAEIEKVRRKLIEFEQRDKEDKEKQKKRISALGQAYRAGAAQITAGTVAATAAVVGWARAGYQGTVQGQALAVRFQQLSREIAATLLPYTDRLTDYMGRLVMWFRQLDGRGQELTGTIIGLGIALKMALSGHPILALITAFAALIVNTKEGRDLLRSMTAAGHELLHALGPLLQSALASATESFKVLADIIKVMADGVRVIASLLPSGGGAAGRDIGQDMMTLVTRGALGNLGGLFRGGRSLIQGEGPERAMQEFMGDRLRNERGLASSLAAALRGQGQGRREMMPAGGGFEGVAESFRRLQVAAIREDIPTRQLAVMEQQLQQAQQTNGLLGGAVLFALQGMRPQPQPIVGVP